jgi:ABC-type glycerol-3-phosphate transport system permease component
MPDYTDAVNKMADSLARIASPSQFSLTTIVTWIVSVGATVLSAFAGYAVSQRAIHRQE